MERITTYFLFGFIPVWQITETTDPTYVPTQWTDESGGYE